MTILLKEAFDKASMLPEVLQMDELQIIIHCNTLK